MRAYRWSFWVCCCLFIGRSASGQTTNGATAEALFDQARSLLQRGSFDSACSKLSESYRLDAAVGTLLNLAECEEARGRTATAWAFWLEAAASARSSKQPDREALARRRAAALRGKLGTLTIDVPSESIVNGLQITRDGVALGAAVWGSETPIDPGEHVIVATAPGRQEFATKVQTSKGLNVRVRVPELLQLASATQPAASARKTEAVDASPGASSSAATFLTLAWAAGSLGVALALVLGLRSFGWPNRSAEEASPMLASPKLLRRQKLARMLLPAAVIAISAAMAYLGWVRGVQPRIQISGAVTDAQAAKTIRIAGDPWSGYSTFRNEPRLKAELARAGVHIDYVDDPSLYDQSTRMQALAEGKIDAAVTTVDAFLQHGTKHRVNGEYPGIIVWNIDESNGGDAIFLAKDRQGFDSVRPTDKVCYASGTPSEHLWDFASLSFANLGDKLATDNGVVASDCWKKLIDGNVQVAVLWQPSTAIALKAGYPKAFATGGQADDVIIDVLVVNRDFANREQAVLTKLTRAYFAVIDSYLSQPEAHAEFITKDCGPDCAGDVGLGRAVLDGIDFLTYRENMCLWWGHCSAPAKMKERIRKTARLLTAKNKLAADAVRDPASLLDDRFLLELKKEADAQSKLVSDVVGQDTHVQPAKLDAEEKTYQYLASTASAHAATEVGTLRLPSIYFPEAGSSLDQNAESVVRVIADQLRAFPALCVRVHGYTNSAGNAENNQRLSEARAISIVGYLGSIEPVLFPRSRFDVRGFGSSAPVLKDSQEDLVASRRTEFKLFNCQREEIPRK